ncbi:MAG: 2-phospho-L-lactate guanylyltransferase [Candidatus Rokubacteria bacterium]|nr:2-phospho-L-lactate guanylyltransferase [Candidatus Rokubacteria bacterium]
MIVVAVPVKDLENAKQRLVPVLSPAERAGLAHAMLCDVLRTLEGARVDEVWVVTRDPAVQVLAREHRCRVLEEDRNLGHTAAARHAQAEAKRAGADVFVTVPGDVPCLTASELDTLVAAVGSAPAAAFSASRSGVGTNGAALAPADLLPLRFGEPSFADHLAAARNAGVEPTVLALPGLGLDIDGADDLRALLAHTASTESARLLRAWAVGARLDGTGLRASR